jgi:hypothetical protein
VLVDASFKKKICRVLVIRWWVDVAIVYTRINVPVAIVIYPAKRRCEGDRLEGP